MEIVQNGGVYTGNVEGMIPHGTGTYTWSNGSWILNTQHGFGRKEYNNGDIYDGSWKVGVHEGSGKYAWSNGDMYIGNWKGGSMCGRGVMKWVNGDQYDGSWSNGYRHGSGVYRFADGSYYFGIWTKGLKDGRGTFYPAGSRCRYSQRLGKKDFKKDIKRTITRRLSRKVSINLFNKDSRQKSSKRIVMEEDGNIHDSILENTDILSHTSDIEGESEADDEKVVICDREYVQGVLIKESTNSDVGLSYKREQQRKYHRIEVKKKSPSEIFDGIKSYYLMLNLQLGIRNLREMFNIDAADYMMSICGGDGLRELPTSGKSGSLFYVSLDDKFVIKTLRTSELKVLLKMLPNYYNHVSAHENTLVTKFYGLHEISLRGGKKVQFVVMGNMFYTQLRIHRRYDLKGSCRGRNTNKADIREGTTFKDLDLTYDFHMDKSVRDALFKQIYLDCGFLESQNIIDYSLLLGLHFRAPKHMNALLEPPDAFHMPRKYNADDDNDGSTDHMDCSIPPKGLLLVTHEPNSVNTAPGPHSRGSTLKAFSIGDKEVDLLLPGTA
nr:phosphatidylinositol 4-phosphate 5-kinase 8-like isoform X1 [Tanacetum cinerariifolium]